MNTFFIVMTVLIVLFVLLNVIVRLKFKNTANVPNSEKIIILTDKNFDQQLKGKKVLVDFWAEWCGPCKMMAPTLNQLAEELGEKQVVAKLNVDDYQSIAQKYQIRSIPTMIIFDNGKEIDRVVGIKTKDFLKKRMS